MHLHESVFFGIVFFLLGIFFAPAMSLAGMLASSMIIAGSLGWIAYKKGSVRLGWLATLALLGILGGLYWTGYNVHQQDQIAPLIGTQAAIRAHVVEVRKMENSQRLIVRLDEPHTGRLSVVARAYPTVAYGDALVLTGNIQRPKEDSWRFLLKDALFATMQFPEVDRVKRNDGNPIVTRLFAIRRAAVETYKRALPADEAALLAGITLGERAEFDREFRENMANSGTTHLVALSGYNISVVAEAILLACGLLLRRTAAFYATLGAVVGFVVMAGAEASVVRAAIMGSIVLLATHIGRTHSMRNAIAISACAMVLYNPNVLRYDLGFQLSFAALIGIIYVKPYLDAYIKRKKSGVLNWRENLSGTLSAQLMVFPILMQSVGSFSLVSLASNIVILSFIPVTMGLGFLIAAIGFVAAPLATIPAWGVSVLLQYEIGVIELFGTYKGFSMPMTGALLLFYYAVVGGMLLYLRHRKTQILGDA